MSGVLVPRIWYHQAPSKPQEREEGATVKMKYILLVVLIRLRNLEFRIELHLEHLGEVLVNGKTQVIQSCWLQPITPPVVIHRMLTI